MDGLSLDWGTGGPWLPAYGLIEDSALYLQPQCALLETILEEDDECLAAEEEACRWAGLGNDEGVDYDDDDWASTSGSSEATSVIHVLDLGDDANDSGSERDFICPPKRRKHDASSDVSSLRCRNYPDYFDVESIHLTSDEDSLSFNSLSRSSSLLQFESLERQFLQDVHSSSPSILSQLSFDSLDRNTNDRKVSPDSLENSDADTKTVLKNAVAISKMVCRSRDNGFNEHSDSDSEFSEPRSSDGDSDTTVQLNSRANSFRSKLRSAATFRSCESLPPNYAERASEESCKLRKYSLKEQRSAENLSEDSGYCDNFCNILKLKSKSIPSLKWQSYDFKPGVERSLKRKSSDCLHLLDNKARTDGEFATYFGAEGCFQPKLSPFRHHSYENVVQMESKPCLKRKNMNNCVKTTHDMNMLPPRRDLNVRQSFKITPGEEIRTKPNVKNSLLNTVISASSPVLTSEIIWSDLFSLSEDKQFDSVYNYARNTFPRSDFDRNLDRLCLLDNTYREIYDESLLFRLKDSVCVTSVPKDLNLCAEIDCTSSGGADWNFANGNNSVAAKNFDLYDLAAEDNAQSFNYVDDFTTSCADLTALNFTERNGYKKNKMAERYKMAANTSRKNSSNRSLFDEVSSHFDKELSILTDQYNDFDNVGSFVKKERAFSEVSKPIQTHSTFDVDPTNLVTCYTESLERCTFNIEDEINKLISKTNVQSSPEKSKDFYNNEVFYHSTPTKREMVVSTPNLNTYDSEAQYIDKIQKEDLRSSMQNVPIKSESELARPHGILGSKNNQSSNSVGQSKGVHFCPVVSEVSWRERSYSDENHSIDESITNSVCSTSSSSSTCSEDSMENEKNVTVIRSEDYKNISQNPDFVLIQPHEPVLRISKLNIELCSPPSSIESDQFQLKYRGDAKYVTSEPAPIVSEPARTQPSAGMPALSNHDVSDRSSSRGSVSAINTTVPPNINKMETTDKMAAFEKPVKKPSFLSRFTSFRFSSRKNDNAKKNKKSTGKENTITVVSAKTTKESTDNNKKGKDNVDYIYIPLKGPIPEAEDDLGNLLPDSADTKLKLPLFTNTNIVDSKTSVKISETSPGVLQSEVMLVNNNDMYKKNISSKPPLPKQPPRIVGVCAKRGKSETAHHKLPLTPLNNIDSRQINVRKLSESEYGKMEGAGRLGLIETNLDTHETVVCNGKTRSLIDLGLSAGAKHPKRQGGPLVEPPRPHKSMEFLLDKENHKVVLPPENELQKTTSMSEHQLRVQRSLQKLNVPEWYKNSQVSREGFLLKKRNSDAGAFHPSANRWTGLNSKTTSLNSLGSQKTPVNLLSPSTHSRDFSRWSTSKLNSTQTSPSSSVRSSFSCRNPAPGATALGSLGPHGGVASGGTSLRSSFRQPYLGWRSQEKLSRPRTPAERLATSILPQHEIHNPESEIQSSIKEVTSAIVHYVTGASCGPDIEPNNRLQDHNRDESGSLSPRYFTDKRDTDNSSQRSRSESPSSKFCWLESSFVGTKPLDSPQTPVILKNFESCSNADRKETNLKLELKHNTDYLNKVSPSPSVEPRSVTPGSATLEDVLASLLGLRPLGGSTGGSQGGHRGSTSAGSFPADMGVASTSTLPKSKTRVQPHGLGRSSDNRRRSEGDTTPSSLNTSRRSSLNLTAPNPIELSTTSDETIVKCRYTKCSKTATPQDAKKHFKNCHNCSYVYCSRECRRAHWEKHRKICLHSRVSALCRQIINSSKDDQVTLKHISNMAKQGYLSHGRGVVKLMFKSPESAENFVKYGFQKLGDISFIKWPDLAPTEMGPELYSELLRLCMAYNPEVKFVLYVSVCVVSEVPTSGAVKWERQLVSRCAKLKLCKIIVDLATNKVVNPTNITRDSPETIILTSLMKGQSTPKTRETAFANVQKHLRAKGVNLKRHFPEVHLKLCSYVENGNDKFIPVTIYPKDHVTGKSFMCIIMPEVDREKLQMLPTDTARVKCTTEEEYGRTALTHLCAVLK